MEEVYAALLLHSANKEITEDAIKKVLEAAGAQVDENKVKALVAALKNVNIDEAIKQAAIATAAAPAEAKEEKKEEKSEEEEKKREEEAVAGLGALFG